MNLASMLDHQARRKPDHPAIMEGGRGVTHRALAFRVRRWARHFLDSGFVPGDVVAVGLRDTADHLIANWAVARMGGIILPVDHRWSASEKRNVVEGFGAAAMLVEADESDGIAVDEGFRAAADSAPADGTFPDDASAPLVLSLSSGTTGTPKGPALTHDQMRARWTTQFVSLGLTEHDRYLSATPLYFGGGRSLAMSAIWCGATVVMFPPPYDARSLIGAIRESGATTTLLVPAILRRLMTEAAGDGPLFSGLRLLLSTGAVLHENERREVMQRLCPSFVNYYGSTEGGGISILTADHGRQAPGSVGRVVFGTEVQVVDGDHNEVPDGETGRIRYRGPGVATEFFRDPESGASRNGWFYPGDLGRFDRDGFLHLAGRDGETINRGSVTVYPADVEAVLLAHSGVADAAVIGVPSLEFGEEIAACVVGTASVDELMAHCRDGLAPYKVPRQILQVEELPRNALGKIRSADLAKRFSRVRSAGRDERS